jgi:sugar phosphate isomerase/epimerase
MRFGFSPVTARTFDTEAAFRFGHEIGLHFIELDYDLHEVMPQVQDPALVRELMAATGLTTTLHLSWVDLNLASLMPVARRAAVERTLAGLEYAHAVGAEAAVLHSGQQYLANAQAHALGWQALEASLTEIAGSGINVVLENLALGPDDLVRTPEELRDLTDRHSLRNCLDTGHAHIQGEREGFDAIGRYLEVLGDRINHLHLHNNHGLDDEHLPTDQGTIDYTPLARYLRTFTGTICLEIGDSGYDGVRASLAHMRRLTGGLA